MCSSWAAKVARSNLIFFISLLPSRIRAHEHFKTKGLLISWFRFPSLPYTHWIRWTRTMASTIICHIDVWLYWTCLKCSRYFHFRAHSQIWKYQVVIASSIHSVHFLLIPNVKHFTNVAHTLWPALLLFISILSFFSRSFLHPTYKYSGSILMRLLLTSILPSPLWSCST